MQLHKQDIEALERKYRLNLINSLSGAKPANLIGTRSELGNENLAIFSSVVHLGSSPAQLGMIMRPESQTKRDTHINILQNGYFTINHISQQFKKQAHYTSAKLEKDVSEFEVMGLSPTYLDDFPAPFVGESAVKLGMKHVADVPLPNGCTFVIGEIVFIDLPDELLNSLGQLDLSAYDAAAISGLNTYYSLKKEASYPYVRTNEIPEF